MGVTLAASFFFFSKLHLISLHSKSTRHSTTWCLQLI
uniref:Uncharacterized protein n=1 Tax=Anguilla anguilla TaxID=7936 RepID=A0A0E9SP02_ANGAN